MKFNNETLRAAVKQWLDDAEAAEATYGHISWLGYLWGI